MSPWTWGGFLPRWRVTVLSWPPTKTFCTAWRRTKFDVRKKNNLTIISQLQQGTRVVFSQVTHSTTPIRSSSSSSMSCSSRSTTHMWLGRSNPSSLRLPCLLSYSSCSFFRLRKSRISTRFFWKHTCSVPTVAPPRFSPATCSTCNCTLRKSTTPWCCITPLSALRAALHALHPNKSS